HLACDKHLHASGLDFVDMHKNIGAAIIGRYKPISAIRVEEFDAPSWHAVNPIHRAGILVPQILGWGEACRPNLVTLESSRQGLGTFDSTPAAACCNDGGRPKRTGASRKRAIMILIFYYIAFLIAGSLAAYLIGLIVEREFGGHASLIVFLALYALSLWL